MIRVAGGARYYGKLGNGNYYSEKSQNKDH